MSPSSLKKKTPAEIIIPDSAVESSVPPRVEKTVGKPELKVATPPGGVPTNVHAPSSVGQAVVKPVAMPPKPATRVTLTGGSSAKPSPIHYYVRAMMKYQASDLHLKVGRPPLFRINGNLVPAQMDVISDVILGEILSELLHEQQWQQLRDHKSIDFSFPIPEIGRFRGNVFYQRGELSAVFRMIPLVVPSLDSLGVPKVVKALAKRTRGLILVTGATGSGKSTTLAGLIQYLNERRNLHILTIEDPIEFLFKDQLCSINQRELGTDFNTLPDALKHGLRQDPDVIVVGEMRDPETIELALTAAETGHLVLSTLHTSDAKQSINRMVDVFPAVAQSQIRIQIASALVGVFSQVLIPKKDGSGRVLASEVLINSPSIETYIVENQLDRINEAIMKSNSYYQMQTMNQDLLRLVEEGKIEAKDALKVSRQPEDLRLRMSGIMKEEGY